MRLSIRFLLGGLLLSWCLLFGLSAAPFTHAEKAAGSRYEIDFGEDESERDKHIDSSQFPAVTVRFRIIDRQTGKPAVDLPDADVVIFEDNIEVGRSRIGGGPISTALTLDTSGSMERDDRIGKVKTAASDFLDELKPEVPCGLVLFNHKIFDTIAPQRNRGDLRERIVVVRAEGGTAYLDATAQAIEMVQSESGRKAVVVMTDGRDVNSQRYDVSSVIRLAKEHKVNVYTVGLGLPGRNDPVRTVLVLDCSRSMLEGGRLTKFKQMKEASYGFVEFLRRDQIAIKDTDARETFTVDAAQTTILPFSTRVHKAGDLTNDQTKLRTTIDGLKADGNTALYDAACEGIRTLEAATFREKQRLAACGRGMNLSVIVLTDGKDTNSGTGVADIVRLHEGSGIKVYTLGLGHESNLNVESMKQIAAGCGGEYFAVPDSAALLRVFENLSIRLHDDGIDEESLQRLANETGGQYFHVGNADQLAEQFRNIAGYLETYHVTYESKRPRKDGLGRSILIKFGDYAEARTGFGLHGLLTPAYDSWIYLFFLLLLGGLLAVPVLMRRILAH